MNHQRIQSVISRMREAGLSQILVTSTTKLLVRANELNGQSIGGKDPELFQAIQREVIREFCDYTGCATLEG